MKKFIKIMCAIMAVAMMATVFASCGDKKETKDNAKDNSKDTVATKVIAIDLTSEEYAFGVDKDKPELLKQVNDFIKEIKENGKFDEICDHFFGDGTPVEIESAKEDSSKDQLIVATNAEFEPFEGKKGDKFIGIDMEIAKLLADKLGKELVIADMDFDSVCLSVGQHKSDIAMAGLSVDPDREKYVTFSDTYYTASQNIIVKGDNTEFDKCKTKEDVEKILDTKDSNVKIGVQNGTTGKLYVSGDKDYKGFKVTCKGYKNGSLAVQDMINGNIDYVVIDSAPAKSITDSINKLS